ncbi:MAG: hypothetical protein GXP62_01615, partial [Oligoflexia bacterium]|nr:hypothetical protein [Oligoflexia bacterium]
ISGRICDPSGKTWLQDAEVYTHVKDGDRIVDTRIAYTDRDGYWLIDALPSERDYDIFVTYGADRLTDQEATGIWLSDGQNLALDDPPCFDPLQVNVAIVSGSYDDFALVLQNMGFGNYVQVNGLDSAELTGFLTDLDQLLAYDIIFFDGGSTESGIFYADPDTSDAGLGGGTGAEDTGATPVYETVQANLQAYVSNGGTIYASDWSYDLVEQTWPDRIDFVGDDATPDAAQLGEYGMVNASVSDGALAGWLDSNYIEIEYDLPVWAPIESVTDGVSKHLTGNVSYRVGTSTYSLPTSPLLVSFTSGEGKVVYATFRVAKNASTEMLMVLQYMMYNL